MTPRTVLLAATALVSLATLIDHVNPTQARAAQPTWLVSPATAYAEFNLDANALTPSNAELTRIHNELRREARNELNLVLAHEFRSALASATVIRD